MARAPSALDRPPTARGSRTAPTAKKPGRGAGSRTKKRVRRPPLRRERIVEAALELADARGLEAVSMREVGRALGVEAMSLYKHVPGKDALLDALVDRVMGEVTLPVVSDGWRQALRSRALSSRQVFLRHPWAASLSETRMVPGPARLALHEATLGVLRAGDFSLELAYRAYLVLDGYVLGFVLQEVSWPFEPDERPRVAEELAAYIPRRRYPHLAEITEHVATRSALRPAGETRELAYAEEFEFGLDLVLDGLERARRRERAAERPAALRKPSEQVGSRSLSLFGDDDPDEPGR